MAFRLSVFGSGDHFFVLYQGEREKCVETGRTSRSKRTHTTPHQSHGHVVVDSQTQ